MTAHQPQLPRLVGWLLRLSPVREESRGEVQADLDELFAERRRRRGALHAHWRLSHDVASLWLQSRPMRTTDSRSSFLRDARTDLRYAVRLFARQPAILLLTIVGLSLGLGISTAAFSVMNVAVLRGEGLVDPERAPGVLRTTDRSISTVWNHDEFGLLREGSTLMQVEGVLADAAVVRTTGAEGEAPSAGLAFVSGGFFSATGARVMAGRPLEPADERHAGPPPVVVSFAFWTSRLDQDPAVVGRTIWIGRTEATVVGVSARDFSVPSGRALWLPLTAYGAVFAAAPPSAPSQRAGSVAAPVRRTPDTGIQVFGRLRPGVSLADAEAQLSGVAAGLPVATAGDSAVRVTLDPHAGLGRMARSERLATTVFVFAVIALVLLLACANVATVLISTAITREREMGVRAALGASRGRLARQLVAESLALGTVAAGIGLLFTYWALPTIGTMIEAPAGTDLAPDLNVFLFLGVVSLLTGLVAGLAPAWHGRSADLITPLKGDSAGPGRLAPRRLRSLLVVTQAAVSVLLIVLSSLFVRATIHAATVDVGFDAAGLYTVSPGLGEAVADDGAAIRHFWARAVSDLKTVPGIARVALADVTPFDGLTRSSLTRDGSARVIYFTGTRDDYFDTIGLRVVAGRTYTRDEIATRAPVAVVSQSLARAYWPAGSPIGQLLPEEIPVSSTRPMVIGVVADAITARLHERNTLTVYEPFDPAYERFAQLLIRVAPGTAAINLASQRLRAIDPQADVRITSVAARVEQEAGRPRMLAILTGVVGVIAIVLCVIGLYGLTASVVGQRTREMSVRIAMGAASRDLLRLLMWDSLRPVVVGLAVGAGAAFLASRVVVAAMFFGVSPQDPMTFAGAAAILLVAAFLAVLVPTRRAASVDAALVLRRS